MWDGFTDDDLRRLKSGECVDGRARELPAASAPLPVAKRQATHLRGSARKNIARERMLQKPSKSVNGQGVYQEELPENARLSKPKEPPLKCDDKSLPSKNGTKDSESDVQKENGVKDTLPSPSSSRKSSTEGSANIGPVCIKIKEGKNYEVLTSEKTPLDEFQSRHKLMEEQNRRRKELLAKALADRKKQTVAEARRLQHIQDELQKLDALLSNDVGILRNQIEAASLEFMDAQKRYDKAEKEYLEAKLYLFGKLERKELLTEHLCKIIEQNEMRKAKKLSELMDKLELGINGDQLEEEQKNTIGSVILPTFCALDEVSYAACNTLKNRQNNAKDNVKESNDESVQNSEPNSKEKVLMKQEDAKDTTEDTQSQELSQENEQIGETVRES